MPAKKTATRGKVKAANAKNKKKDEDEDEEDDEDEVDDEDEDEEDEDEEEDEEEEDEDDEDEDEEDEDEPKKKGKKSKDKDKGKKKSKSRDEVTHRKKDLSSNPGRKGTKRWALVKALEKAGDSGSSADKIISRAKEYFKKATGKLSKDDDEKFDRIGRSGVSDLINILKEMGYKGAFNKDGKFGITYKK